RARPSLPPRSSSRTPPDRPARAAQRAQIPQPISGGPCRQRSTSAGNAKPNQCACHSPFHKKHKLVAVLTANRQFYKFIIITIILPFTHDSGICPTACKIQPLCISAREERPSIYILYDRPRGITDTCL